MDLHLGIDLHSDNGYYGILDKDGKRVFDARLPNELEEILAALEPYRKELVAVVIESTYNWYWLADGLMENGYDNVLLANPAAMEQYGGLKYADDKTDALWIAEMSRLGVVPTGHIYPKERRPVRDLMRRRMLLVGQRTTHILSFQSLLSREFGTSANGDRVKTFEEADLDELFDDAFLRHAGGANLRMMKALNREIRDMEKLILAHAKLEERYERLTTVPGIGKILALTIMYETGDIDRFAGAGNFTSYCRCVKSGRWSNDKRKGAGNGKCGNRYLAWAFVEAANFHRRYCPEARRFYDRKKAKTNSIVATKALAAKLTKACYFIMRDNVDFDVKRIFG